MPMTVKVTGFDQQYRSPPHSSDRMVERRSRRAASGTRRTMSSVTVPTQKQPAARYSAGVTPASSMTPPARAGPKIRPEFITAEFRTTAFIRSSRSTRSRTMASRVGVLMAWRLPRTKAAA